MHGLAGLQVCLFGGFRLIYEGKLVTTFVQARLQTLLAYLLLHRHAPQPREMLAYLFWPDSSDSQARTNLRQLLHHLQRALPEADHYLQIEKKTIVWRPEAVFTFDVIDFEQNILQAEQARRKGQLDEARRMLEAAVQCYQGDLLPACYDDWILSERERLRQSYFSTLEELIKHLAEQHDYRASIVYEEALLRHDPLRETTYQQLMRLHAFNGDRASALRVYHSCVSVLERELGVRPSSETQAAYQQLLNVSHPAAVDPQQKVYAGERSTLVGRQREWHILQATWRRTIDGYPGLVLISGEAGIGKTRLAEEFLEWAGHQGASTGKTRSYAAEGQLAFAPAIELLRTEPFRTGLFSLDPVWLTELARLMPELLVERQDFSKPEPITEAWQRKRLFEALARAIDNVKEPLVLLFDDLQWCDRDTMEWLHFMLHFCEGVRLLIIGVARLEEIDEAHPLAPLMMDLRNREHFTEIELGPLGESDATDLAEQVAGKWVDPDRAARLYIQSEGNPLFLVEMARAAINAPIAGGLTGAEERALSSPKLGIPLQARRSSSANLPSKVYTVIQTRLRQLSPPARELASLAAAIGRAFSIEILSHASEMDDEGLVQGLDELWRRRMVREQDHSTYDFSHDLIREVAYTETSTARRRLLHRRIAKAFEQIYAESLDEVSSQIAVHYAQAELNEPAIEYYQRAAKVAQKTFSNAEIIRILNSALILLPGLPETPEKHQTELNILLTLGEAYMLSQGYGHPIVERVLLKAWKACQTLAKSRQTVPVLAGLWICYHVRGDMPQEIAWAEMLEREMQRGIDECWVPYVYLALIQTAFFKGDFLAAKHYGESQFHRDEVGKPGQQPILFGYEPKIPILAYWAHSLWILGFLDQARTQVKEAVDQAADSEHPGNLLIGLSLQSVFHQFSREHSLALRLAESVIDFSVQKLIPDWKAHGQILHGWALAQEGQADRGIAEQREGLASLQEMGTGLARPYYLLLLAESYLISGQLNEGLKAVEEALATVQTGQERCFEAELYRCQGELLLAKGDDELEAETCFQQAIETARRQQALSFELRASVSLCRLWQQQGKRAEAYHLLSEVYDKFTEGFDTAELRQAQMLLNLLS